MVSSKWNIFSYTFCTIIISIFLIFLSWLRSYALLVPTSKLGLIALIFAIIVTIINSFQEILKLSYSTIYNQIELYNINNPLFIGNAAFLYLIHSVILPIEQGMRKRKRFEVTHGFGIALKRSMILDTIFNLFLVFTFRK